MHWEKISLTNLCTIVFHPQRLIKHLKRHSLNFAFWSIISTLFLPMTLSQSWFQGWSMWLKQCSMSMPLYYSDPYASINDVNINASGWIVCQCGDLIRPAANSNFSTKISPYHRQEIYRTPLYTVWPVEGSVVFLLSRLNDHLSPSFLIVHIIINY